MSVWYLLATAVVAVNAARVRPALPEAEGRRIVVSAAGAAIVFAISASAMAWAGPVLDSFDISPETWRIAAGAVAAVVAAWVLVFPVRRDEPGLSGSAAAVVPVAFPLLLTPELAGFLVLFGATEPAATWLPAVGMALLTVPAAAALGVKRTNLWAGSSRLLAMLLMAVAIAQVVEGIRDV